MKNYFIVLCGLFIVPLYAFDTSCLLEKSAPIIVGPEEVILVSSHHEIYPLQNGEIVPIKKSDGEVNPEFIDYVVVESSGFIQPDFSKILDNNSSSFLQFSENPKSLTLKLDTPVSAGEFRFHFEIQPYDFIDIEISRDGKKYVGVHPDNVADFSFSYMRLSVIDKTVRGKESLYIPTKIRDILFVKNTPQAYFMKSRTGEPIVIYTHPVCGEDIIHSELAIGYQQGHKILMSVDKKTRSISVITDKNEVYNADQDNDGVSNELDNCIMSSNVDQKDSDRDRIGDACDLDPKNRDPYLQDTDGDGMDDVRDNCPFVKNPDQKDNDSDGEGDVCSDDDSDDIYGFEDNCPTVFNPDQEDINVNNVGDVCEKDGDSDGFFDTVDNCPRVSNLDQKDDDLDGIGSVCDNCPRFNPNQRDENKDNIGDECTRWEEYQKSHDDDIDGVINWDDNCPKIANSRLSVAHPKTGKTVLMQPDKDVDGIGDACDNCITIQNPDQQDVNKNTLGDMCEDMDADGLLSYEDNCPLDTNPDQRDQNNDEVGDLCEDADRDALRYSVDNCPFESNVDQLDSDKDNIGDVCDPKDDRFLESNKTAFVTIFTLIGMCMLLGIGYLANKLISSR